jgi:hypothetical protein
MLEGGYSMHGPIAVVTAARAQIHHHPRAARMRAGARDTEPGRTQRKRRSELGHPLQPKSDLSDFGRLKMPNLAKPEFGAAGWRAHEWRASRVRAFPLFVHPPDARHRASLRAFTPVFDLRSGSY